MLHSLAVRRAVTPLACAVAALALACSGGSDPVTPEQAAAIVAAGVLMQEDLPAGSWAVEETDNLLADAEESEGAGAEALQDPDDLFANTPSCQAVAALLEDLNQEDVPPLADLERSFTTGGESLVVRNVVSNVFVPDEQVEIDEAFNRLQAVFSADGMRACFEDAFRESLESEEGIVLSGLEVHEPEYTAEGGVGIAVDLEALAVIIPIALHLELHMWAEGPAVSSLVLMELNSDLVQRNAGSIVDNARSRLAAAVEAN